MNFTDDDFFSPVRHVSSDSDSSDEFENSSNVPCSDMTVTFVTASKKNVSEHTKAKCDKGTNELGSCSSESSFASKPEDTNICTPALKRNSARLKRESHLLDLSKVKLEREKYSKDNIKRERSSKNSEEYAKKQDYQQSEAMADCDAAKSNIKQIHVKKSSLRPTSLSLSKKEVSKFSATKELKEKNVAEFSKNICNLDKPVSNIKHSKKKLLGSSLEARNKNFDVSDEKSTDSNSIKSRNYNSSNSKSDTSNKKSGLDQNVENSKSSLNMPVNTPFELSVEKIVHDLISSECDTMRRNMYAQQMCFFRELNKVKEERKRQHLADTEHMLKIIKQLVQMNFTLKSKS